VRTKQLFAASRGFLKDLARAAHSWLAHEGLRLSASLSFYSLLSLAPLVILSIAIASFAFGRSAAQSAIIDAVQDLMGTQGVYTIQLIIQHGTVSYAGGAASLIGLAILLFGASSVFGELQSGLNKIWDTAPASGLGVLPWIKSRLLSFALVLAFGFLLLVSLVFSAAIAAFGRLVSVHLSLPHALLIATDAVVSLGAIFALLALILRYVPDVPLRWRDVWQGALATALLFTCGKALFGLYLGTAAVISAYGAAGSLIVVILWVYYSAMIFYFGAALTRVRSRAARTERRELAYGQAGGLRKATSPGLQGTWSPVPSRGAPGSRS
jgi:membrane protein